MSRNVTFGTMFSTFGRTLIIFQMKKILVVDDEKDIGLLMKLILKAVDREVVYVPNLEEAENALENYEFESVFLDINLKGELGLDLIPTIREQKFETNIFIITAQKDQKLLDQVNRADVQKLIEKPLTRDKIFNAIRL